MSVELFLVCQAIIMVLFFVFLHQLIRYWVLVIVGANTKIIFENIDSRNIGIVIKEK